MEVKEDTVYTVTVENIETVVRKENKDDDDDDDQDTFASESLAKFETDSDDA